MSVKKLLFAAVLSASAFAGGIGLTIASGWLITMAAEQPPILTLTVAIVGVRFFGISRSAFRYAERVISHGAVFSALTYIRSHLFNVISQLPVTKIRTLVEGSFAKTIVDDVERAQEFQLRNKLPQLSALLSVLIGTLIAFWVSPSTLYFTLPAALMFFLVIPGIVNWMIFTHSFRLEERENSLSNALTISAGELQEGEIFGYYDQIIGSTKQKISTIAVMERRLLRNISFVQLATLGTLGFSLLAAIQVARSLYNPPSVRITMVIFIPLVIYEAINSWYPTFFTSAKLLRAQRSVDSILATTPEKMAPMAKPDGYDVQARSVSVSWSTDFMQEVSFQAGPDAPLLITGNNGSGKSTLALAVAGLLPYRGSIRVCGSEVRDYSNNEAFTSAALQEAHIFNTSIRENLKIGNQNSSDQDLLEVLRLLELDYISLDEIVGEFGRKLSGGEAKRLAVSRALISQSPVVILDEPLEHLDEERANRLEGRILSYLQKRTLIVIAHSGWRGLTNTLVLRR